MKNKIVKTLSKPKTIVPVFAVLAVIVLALTYSRIGNPPKVTLNSTENSVSTLNSSNTINLSFPKNGRVGDVLVKVGDVVHKGDVLAKLDAPDALGLVSQAKGALDLAEAEYASLNLQYKNAKKQQDLLVENAYKTLLSSGLTGEPNKQTQNSISISGTYTCDKEGSYNLDLYGSADNDTGLSFKYSGLESGVTSVKYDNPIPLGSCGLQIRFNKVVPFDTNINWTINIPNEKSSVYLANKNAYELALNTREKVLSELETTLVSGNGQMSIEQAKVNAARGAYDAALGAYENNVLRAPSDGTISFIDSDLKIGQGVIPNKNVISITTK